MADKFFLIVTFIVGVCVLEVLTKDLYTSKFDSINLDDILNSERLLRNYVNCLKGTGKCTPDGSELKRVLPEALETECAKCTEQQREGTKKVVSFLVNKKPEMWKELAQTYDPEGVYQARFKESARKEGINV